MRSIPCAIWTGGGDADGTEYANAVSQASFRAVAVAANDVAAVFQRDAPELSSLFVVWALQETQRCMCQAQPACSCQDTLVIEDSCDGPAA